jgi:DNA-binding response OmpR family regulator
VLLGLAVLGLASAVFVLRRPLTMAAPVCMAGRWHGCYDTFNGVVLMTLVTMPLAALVVWALALRRRAAGGTSAWRTSVAEVGMVHGTVLRLEAIAADIAGDGDSALELLSVNSYDLAVLDRDIPGPSGDEVARRIVASGSGMPILMLTAADRIDDKASGFGLGADDYLTKPFELRELVLRLRALDRRRAYARPPVREIAGLRLDPFRREVFRDGRYVALTRKQFAVLDVLVAAEGGVVSAEELLERTATRV